MFMVCLGGLPKPLGQKLGTCLGGGRCRPGAPVPGPVAPAPLPTPAPAVPDEASWKAAMIDCWFWCGALGENSADWVDCCAGGRRAEGRRTTTKRIATTM